MILFIGIKLYFLLNGCVLTINSIVVSRLLLESSSLLFFYNCTEKLLNGAYVIPVQQEVGGVTVAKTVAGCMPGDAGFVTGRFHGNKERF